MGLFSVPSGPRPSPRFHSHYQCHRLGGSRGPSPCQVTDNAQIGERRLDRRCSPSASFFLTDVLWPPSSDWKPRSSRASAHCPVDSQFFPLRGHRSLLAILLRGCVPHQVGTRSKGTGNQSVVAGLGSLVRKPIAGGIRYRIVPAVPSRRSAGGSDVYHLNKAERVPPLLRPQVRPAAIGISI